MTLLLHCELLSRVKLCLVSVFPHIIKDCSKMRNLSKIFLRSFKNVAPAEVSSVIMLSCIVHSSSSGNVVAVSSNCGSWSDLVCVVVYHCCVLAESTVFHVCGKRAVLLHAVFNTLHYRTTRSVYTCHASCLYWFHS